MAGAAVRIPMPAAVLAGGASRRMGRPKAQLPYGATTLLAFQTTRLDALFEVVLVVAKEAPRFETGPARVVLDGTPEHAAIHGLVRALEEAADRVFVLAVDLPVLPVAIIHALAERSLVSDASALLPRAEGRLEPLAGVWRRAVLPLARHRIGAGELSLQGLAEEAGAEIFEEPAWRALDPSGNAFENLNTLERYAALRERA